MTVAVLNGLEGNASGLADRRAREEDLLARAKSGDVAAFESLMVQYQKLVLATALRLLGNRDDARDAAQEVFLRFYRYIHTLEARRPLAVWLYRVTINACRDQERRRKRRGVEVSLDQHEEGGFNPAGGEDTAGNLERREEARILQEALAALPPKTRAAIVLRDLQDLPTSEVARIMRISEVTVRSHISMARMRIKKYRDRALGRRQ
jgi:RNA polymerase sigma-70 factor (ECF subfamily)